MQRLSASMPAVLSLLAGVAHNPAFAENAVLRMTRADCARMVAHWPAPDVSYQPGIDVRGHAVPPAETKGDSRLRMSEDIVIPLELRLFDRLGGERAAAEARVLIGTVELRAGRAYFNGQPLEEATAAELAAMCSAKLNRGR